jgi:hypothetical protein
MHAVTHNPPDDPVQRLRTLSGVYRRSRGEELFVLFGITVGLCAGAYLLGAAVAGFYTSRRMEVNAALAAAGLVITVVAVYVLSQRKGVSYRLESGRLSEISSSGRIRWEEDLSALVSLRRPVGVVPSMPILALQWASHSRRIELFDSLSKALFK